MNPLTDGDQKSPLEERFFDNLVWLSAEEAAKYLRKTANALRVAVCRKQIRAYRWRRRLYFKRTELDRVLERSIR